MCLTSWTILIGKSAYLLKVGWMVSILKKYNWFAAGHEPRNEGTSHVTGKSVRNKEGSLASYEFLLF